MQSKPGERGAHATIASIAATIQVRGRLVGATIGSAGASQALAQASNSRLTLSL